jgi:hypothetical protein
MRLLRPAIAACVIFAALVGPSSATAEAQQAGPTRFCALAAAVPPYRVDLPGDRSSILAQVAPIAESYRALVPEAPPELAADITQMADALSRTVDQVGAIDPSLPLVDQDAALRVAAGSLYSIGRFFSMTSDAVAAYVADRCAPVGGVAAGLGGARDEGTNWSFVALILGLGMLGVAGTLYRRSSPISRY